MYSFIIIYVISVAGESITWLTIGLMQFTLIGTTALFWIFKTWMESIRDRDAQLPEEYRVDWYWVIFFYILFAIFLCISIYFFCWNWCKKE